MLFRQISFISQSWILLFSILTVLNAKVLAEPRPFSSFRHRNKASLTCAIFDRSDNFDERETSTAFSSDFSKDFFSVIGSPDHGRYPWKQNIVTTVFWIGEGATRSNPVPNTKSAWDLRWGRHYGGYDNPTDRANYIPARFIPNQNPFYVALPYNDVNHKHTRPEGRSGDPVVQELFCS